MATCVQPPTCFWASTSAQPSANFWYQWKLSFTDYIDLLDELNPAQKLSESCKLKLLRHHLGDEGQKYFDTLDLRGKSSLSEALAVLDRSWGARTNVFASRFKFSQLRQDPGERLESFITRLIQSVKLCDYATVPQKKIESTLLTQQFIVGVTSDRIRDALLSEESHKLTWERACELARVKTDVEEHSKLFQTGPATTQISKLRDRKNIADGSQGVCFR